MKKIFRNDNAEHKTIKERLSSRQLHLKLIALGLAVILWLYVSAEDSVGSIINNKEDDVSEKSYTVQVVTEGLPDGMEIRSELPDVQLVLQGTAEDLLQIENEDLQAKADLSGAVPGLNEIELEMSVPENAELISSSAQTVIVEIASVSEEQEETTQTEQSSETSDDTSEDASDETTDDQSTGTATEDTSEQTDNTDTADQTESGSTGTDSSQSAGQSAATDEETEQSSSSGTEGDAATESTSGN